MCRTWDPVLAATKCKARYILHIFHIGSFSNHIVCPFCPLCELTFIHAFRSTTTLATCTQDPATVRSAASCTSSTQACNALIHIFQTKHLFTTFLPLIYFISDEALKARVDHPANADLNLNNYGLLADIDREIRTVNPFAAAFQFMLEVEQKERDRADIEHRPPPDLRMVIDVLNTPDPRR